MVGRPTRGTRAGVGGLGTLLAAWALSGCLFFDVQGPTAAPEEEPLDPPCPRDSVTTLVITEGREPCAESECLRVSGGVSVLPPLPNFDLSCIHEIGGDLLNLDPRGMPEFPNLVRIDGDLIGGPGLDLRSLPALEVVGGSLPVESGSVGSLPRLREIGLDLVLSRPTDRLISLPSLQQVGRNLEIFGGVELGANEVVEFPALRTVAGEVTLSSALTTRELLLPALERTSALRVADAPALEHLRIGAQTEASTVSLESVPLLSDVAGGGAPGVVENLSIRRAGTLGALPRLGLADADAIVVEHTGLTNLNFLEGLTTATSLRIAFNHDLADIEGLSGLESVAGDLRIADNWRRPEAAEPYVPGALADLTGLDALTDVGGSFYAHTNDLDRVTSLTALRRVGENLDLNAPRATEVSGFTALESVGGDLDIRAADAVITSPRALATVGGEVHITAGSGLRLEALENVGDALTLEVADGSIALPVLTRVERAVTLRGAWTSVDLPRLVAAHSVTLSGGDSALDGVVVIPASADGFAVEGTNLVHLTGVQLPAESGLHITLWDNDSLLDIGALAGLRSTDTIWIEGQALLSDLTPLHGLLVVGGDLLVVNNASLPPAAAQALADALGDSVAGAVTIESNGTALP